MRESGDVVYRILVSLFRVLFIEEDSFEIKDNGYFLFRYKAKQAVKTARFYFSL
ncbi:hypothetical protein BH09BAC2_BH09BAC2_16170 [soil metagenome]